MYFIKHRPISTNDLVYNKEIYNMIRHVGLTNNLLLYGYPGSGKNTICKIFLRELFGDGVLNMTEGVYNIDKKKHIKFYHSPYHFEFDICNYLNKDKLFVSELITSLSSTKNILTNDFKVLVIKNADKLIYNTQAMLRRIIEKSKSKFIFITSRYTSIIEPLRSRFMCVRIPAPCEIHINTVLTNIAAKEGIKLSKRNLTTIKKKSRNMKELITLLEMCYINGKFKNVNFDYVNKNKKLIKILKKLNITNYHKFKEHIYDMYSNGCSSGIDFIEYIKTILNEVLPLFDGDNNNELKIKLVNFASICDIDVQYGNKPPIHFEKFLINVYSLILDIKEIKEIK